MTHPTADAEAAERGDEAAALVSLRAAVVAAGRRLGARGLISAGEGNLSVRLPGQRLLITPSGLRKDELAVGDLLVVPLSGDPGIERNVGAGPGSDERPPSSDLAIHRAVLQARRDVSAVVHAHLPAAMALSLAGEQPDPGALPETALLLPALPVVPFGQPGSDELAARIAEAFRSAPVTDDPGSTESGVQRASAPNAVLLERHGAVAVGGAPPGRAGVDGDWSVVALAAIEQAIDRLELVEVLCRTWRDALLLRAARRLVGDDDSGREGRGET